MKREITNRKLDPSDRSLEELPEIDFSKFRIRRNPYAARIAREGYKVVHDEPSAASLAQMPEVDFARARVRANTFAGRAGKAASNIQYGKGRPRVGNEVGRTPSRSLRLPAPLWQALELEALERMTTVHALLRELVVTHISQLQAAPKTRSGKRTTHT
jgi:hypothetical protein